MAINRQMAFKYLNDVQDERCPKNETIAEHRTHCEAKPGNCPFEKESAIPNSKDALSGVYAEYLRYGFTDSVLRNVDEIDDEIADGKLTPLRVPAELMSRSGSVGMPKWFRSLYHLMAYRSCTTMPLKLNDTDFIMDYASARGKWSDDLNRLCRTKLGEPFGAGEESDVYDAKSSVIKTFTDILTPNMLTAMERVMLGNYYFPEAKYDILGFGIFKRENNSFIGMLLKQRKFDFSVGEMCDAELLKYIFSLGLTPEGSGDEIRNISRDGMLSISDMHSGNVRKTSDGSVIAVDVCCMFNQDKYDFDNPPRKMPRITKGR